MAAEDSARQPKRAVLLRRVERGLLLFGSLFLGIFVSARVDRAISLHETMAHFREISPADSVAPIVVGNVLDLSRRSENGERAYQKVLAEHVSRPLAVLRIARVHLEVPVLDGTSTLALNRGVGHIRGTAAPGEGGNTGIAGHRDGFFRLLRDVRLGDSIELERPGQTLQYRVTEILIVEPNNVDVLQPKTVPSLTLITCFPFYFIGSAPKRYVVEASLGAWPGRASLQIAKHVRTLKPETEVHLRKISNLR
jgi:sortase A